MSPKPPLSPNTAPSPSLHSSARSDSSKDMGREAMQEEYGMGGESMMDSKTSLRSDQQVMGGPHEVSRLVPPYRLQSGTMSCNKDFTTSPYAYATTGVGPAPQMAMSQNHPYHPYNRNPHSSSPPVMVGHHNMLATMPSALMPIHHDPNSPYIPMTYPSPAGSIASSMGSPMSSMSSFGSQMSDMSSTFGYSPPMPPPAPLPSLGYANPRELHVSRRHMGLRRAISETNDDDDEEEMLQDGEGEHEHERGGGPIGLGIGMDAPTSDPDTHGTQRDAKAEAGRLNRIQSEQKQRLMWQKRRNVLRDGFERLRAELPPTNQKASKQVLLDRAITQIQAMAASNSFLVDENRTLKAENDDLRRANNRLVESTMMRTQAGAYDPKTGPSGPNGHSSGSRGSSNGPAGNGYGGRT